MIQHSAAYSEAVVADSRRQYVRAIFDLADPDMEVTSVTSNDEGALSDTDNVTARGSGEADATLATLERNRWILDGTQDIAPDDLTGRTGQVGWEGAALSGDDGAYPSPAPYIEIAFKNVEILQAVTLQFSTKDVNGFPDTFAVEVWAGETSLFSRTISGNKDTSVVVDGFIANYPTRLRVTVSKWSMPRRVVRIPRILLGLYETWDGSVIQSVDVYTEVTFSGLKIPYSTCTIRVENKDHRFDPYAPNTIFTSVEDRQKIVVEYGLRLADGSTEWLPAGTYFQQSAGWTLQDLTVQWDLLDIIGALTKRRFVVPTTLPTTLSGWLEAVMSSLGTNFKSDYIVDSDVASIAVTSAKDKVSDKRCGEILRFLCMATNTWPRQDFATGFLRVGKLQRLEGNRVTLDDMSKYPEMSANDDIADITFKLDDGEVTFAGNNTESEVSLSVDNPFVHTQADAQKAVISCLFEYGGRSFSVTSRGNPSSECGDIMAVDTQFNSTISARLYKQQLSIGDGVMLDMPSLLVQSPNDAVYANKTILTSAGTWTSPVAGTIRVTVIGGGAGGTGGGGGVMLFGTQFDPTDTTGGTGGSGGKVAIATKTVTLGQVITYSCGLGGDGGAGGAPGHDGLAGTEGTATTFDDISSADGKVYPLGLMDVQTGAVYAQKGEDHGGPVSGLFGSGGAGGKMGRDGRYSQTPGDDGKTYTAAKATAGTDGADGKAGCVILEW